MASSTGKRKRLVAPGFDSLQLHWFNIRQQYFMQGLRTFNRKGNVMTNTGEQRKQYSEQVEAAPSIFSVDYDLWAIKADIWASNQKEIKVTK